MGSATKTTMNPAFCVWITAVMASFVIAAPGAASPVGTAFTYQGQLLDGGMPASGMYDLKFELFDDPATGSQVGSTLFKINQSVNQGLFAVDLDFGPNAFGADARWLEIATRQAGVGAYVDLLPRQRLYPTPFAISAQNLGGNAAGDFVLRAGDIMTGALEAPQFNAVDGLMQRSVEIMPAAGGRRGVVAALGENGSVNSWLGFNPANWDHGQTTVHDAAGAARAGLEVDVAGAGAVFAQNAAGAEVAAMAVSNVHDGIVETRGPNGALNAAISGQATAPDRGILGIYDAAGASRALLFANGDGAGELLLDNGVGDAAVEATALGTGEGFVAAIGPNGGDNVTLTSLAGNPNNGFVAAHNSAGATRAGLFANSAGRGELFANNGSGNLAWDATALSGGEGVATTFGPNGSKNTELSSLSGNANNGYIGAFDSDGVLKAGLFVNASGEGELILQDDDGQMAVQAEVLPSDEGFLRTLGANGQNNVLLTSVTGFPNNGAILVVDAGGTAEAGFFVNAAGNGEMFADLKAFDVPYPGRPGSRIQYICLEGPEAGIYCRGTVRLEAGRATIALPEHFAALANPRTMTVQLTPGSLESRGVAVGEIRDDAIVIGELMEGKGEYDVHYLVHATRAGYEDLPVVVDEAERQARFSAGSGAGAAGIEGPVEGGRPSEREPATAIDTAPRQSAPTPRGSGEAKD